MRRPSSQVGLALCGEQILKDGGKFVVHEGALKVFHNLVLNVIVVHLESQQKSVRVPDAVIRKVPECGKASSLMETCGLSSLTMLTMM